MTNFKDSKKIGASGADPEAYVFGGDREVLLTEFDVARRQRRSVKTIRNQRVLGTGIPFIKIGRLVRYRLQDVIASEETSLRKSTGECTSNSVLSDGPRR